MKQITVNNFGGGMATDIYSGSQGEFSTTRNFDILSYPNKLYPLASMASGTADTGIMNMLTAADGVVYGLSNHATKGGIWSVNGSNDWEQEANGGGSSSTSTDFFVEHKEYGARFLLFYDATGISAVDPIGNTSGSAATFTATSIGQGYVHPKDKVLYVPYQISGTTVIGTMVTNSWTPAVLTLPSNYRIVGLTHYGNYLAIGCTIVNTSNIPNSVNASVVYLWDRDTSLTTLTESIPWGDNQLQVLNNLNGVLIGISKYQDDDNTSLLIKGYAGGEVEVLKEIPAIKETTTSPSLTINTRVNLIHKNRLYFSADLTGGSTSPSHKGLWSFGKNKNGTWSTSIERFASTDGSDVSVLAATFRLGYLYTCHTATGTLTDNGILSSTLATRYASPSIYESLVNPNMSDLDKLSKKKLVEVACNYIPIPSGGSLVMEYRVDGGSWTNIFTETTAGEVKTSTTKPTTGQFTDGYNYEFRIESTGFVQVVGFTYSYQNLP